MIVSGNYTLIAIVLIWIVMILISAIFQHKFFTIMLGLYTIVMGIITWNILTAEAGIRSLISLFFWALGVVFLALGIKS